MDPRRAVSPRWAAPLAWLALALGCEDAGSTSSGPSSSSAGGGGAEATGAGGFGAGGAQAGGASVGGAALGGAAAGGSGGDLGWPFDDTVPSPCPPTPLGEGGVDWAGWVNLQFPALLEGQVGQASEAIYGQAYAAGVTAQPGPSDGWESEIGVGPWGTLPEGDARCWSFVPAEFNTDVGNNDEYAASVEPAREGLFAYVHRVRPAGGAWRYGDLDGSDDGLGVSELGLLDVASTGDAPLVIATLNLRCRIDDWAARRPLVVRALARIQPDVVALQEDCLDPSGRGQGEEVAALLAAHTKRGYQVHRETTHVATSGSESFPEGIAVMSAHRLDDVVVLDLPHANFPRKAIGVDLVVRGRALRFYATHFDYGSANQAVRAQSAQLILADAPVGVPTFVAGDLNAEPGESGPLELADALVDLWAAANPSQPGLTMPASGPTRRIDFVFASAPAAPPVLEPLGARLLDEAEDGVLLSDHLGVAAAVAW